MKILSFGEILWDIFDDKKEIGGAPLNFSAHCAKLGADVYIISSVGKDELGYKSIEITQSFNINKSFISESTFETGVCYVTVDSNGHPDYNLVKNVAYDFIFVDNDLINCIKQGFDVFYFGTLAQRNFVSRNALKDILKRCRFKEIFCDLNIRQDYYSKEIIENCLINCTILKVSREEYKVFEQLDIIDIKRVNYENDIEYSLALCKQISQKYSIKLIIVTMDKDGAFVYNAITGDNYLSKKPINKAISTVGAGDSFSACFIYNYMKKAPLQDCINKAVALSDYVVTKMGAIPDYTHELLNTIT